MAYSTILVIAPLVAAGQAVVRDLQDLHANVFYGNAEGQQENNTETLKSLAEWLSAQREANRVAKSDSFEALTGQPSFSERIGILEIDKHVPSKGEMRRSANPDRVIVAIEKINQIRCNNLSVMAFFHSQFHTPKIGDFDNNEDTTVGQLFAARARLLEIPRSEACESGELSVNETVVLNYFDDRGRRMGHTSHQIEFNNGYSSKPIVLCWISGIKADTASSDLLMRVDPENVTPDGFTLKISTKRASNIMDGLKSAAPVSGFLSGFKLALPSVGVVPPQLRLEIGWFAYSPDHPHVTSGRSEFTKRGHHSLAGYMPSQRVTFPQGMFQGRRPFVFAGFNLLEFNHQTDIRAEIVRSDVTTEGMKVALNAWLDTDCYLAGISWFAFDEKFFKYRLPQ